MDSIHFHQSFSVVIKMPRVSIPGGPTYPGGMHPREVSGYVRALLAELYFRSQEPKWENRSIRSVTFEGGSAWLLSPRYLTEILIGIHEWFSVEEGCVIEAYAQPAHLHIDSYKSFQSAGLSRLIVYARSLDDHVLSNLGCSFKSKRVQTVLDRVIGSGLKLGVELCYGLPFQTLPVFRDTLFQVLRKNPEVVRFVPPMAIAPFLSSQNILLEREEHIVDAIAQRRLLASCLDCFGLREEQLNVFERSLLTPVLSRLEQKTAILGIGADAFCRVGEYSGEQISYHNTSDPVDYINRIQQSGRAETHRWSMTKLDLLHEALFIAICSPSGLHLKGLEERFDLKIEDVHPGLIELLVSAEYMCWNGGLLQLTPRGVLFSKNVIENFFVQPTDVPYLRGERQYV